MKELIISTVLQDGIAGQSHSSKKQRGFDWILEKTKWLYWHWSPWQPCGTMAQSCPPWLHPQLQPPQRTQSLIGEECPHGQTYSSHVWGPVRFLQAETVTTSHPISLFPALLSLVFPYSLSHQGSPSAWDFSVLFVCVQIPYCCQHHW